MKPARAAAVEPTVAEALARAGLPPAEARLLLSRALGLKHAQLAAHPERRLEAAAADRFLAWTNRRRHGEPVAYILGEKEFYGRRFRVSPAVLIPRPETELLVDLARELPLDEPAHVLDLGTGSGALAVTLALELPDAQVAAVESSRPALALARDNARAHQASVRWLLGDWYDPLCDECFDLIVSNPPYIPEDDPHLAQGDVRFEPRQALTPGPRGTEAIERIIRGARRHLCPGGHLLLEHGYDQSESCRALLQDAGFFRVRSWNDLAGIPRVSGGCRT